MSSWPFSFWQMFNFLFCPCSSPWSLFNPIFSAAISSPSAPDCLQSSRFMKPVGPQVVYVVITAVLQCWLETLKNDPRADERMRLHHFLDRCLVSRVSCLRCVCDPGEDCMSVNCWYIFKILLYVRQFSLDRKLAVAFHAWPLANNFLLSSWNLWEIEEICQQNSRISANGEFKPLEYKKKTTIRHFSSGKMHVWSVTISQIEELPGWAFIPYLGLLHSSTVHTIMCPCLKHRER